METVVIDDVPATIGTSASNIVIDLDEENSNDVIEVIEILPIPNDNQMAQIQEINKENKALGELIEKCLALDTSGAMLRVINRTLIPLYKNHGRNFNNAMQKLTFERALTKALIQIEIDPMYKYSHVKEFCETLKSLKEKKKVQFVTLSKKSKEKSNPFHRTSRKRPRFDNAAVINLDEDEFEESPYLYPNANKRDVTALQSHQENEKENSSSNVNMSVVDITGAEIVEQHFIEIDVANEIVFNPDTASSCYKDKSYCVMDIPAENSDVLPATQVSFQNSSSTLIQGHSVADTAVSCAVPTQEENKMEQIKSIEADIEVFQKIVEQMNLKEVTQDSQTSPYLQCEFYQLKIVKSYEKLCELTGRPPVKRREVRLSAADTRSELPLKKLEKLINDNIGSDGLPHFPDFQEVVGCVREANEEGCLGWHPSKIMNEARALFAHCGRALQRNRQRREWRDMRRLLKGAGAGAVLRDPADDDPELRARLELNRHAARVKETEILERFSAMESKSSAARIEANAPEYDDNGNEDGNENQIRIVQVVSCDQTDLESGITEDLIELNSGKVSSAPNNNVEFVTKSVADKDFTNYIGETNTVLILDPQFYNKVMSQVLVDSGIAANSALVRNNNEALTHIRVCQTDVNPKKSYREKDPNNLNKNVQIANDVVHKDFTNHNGKSSTNQISDLSFRSTVVPQQVLSNSIITTDVTNGASQCNDTLTQVGAKKSHIEVLSIEIDNSPDEYLEDNNNEKDITKIEENKERNSSIISYNSEVLNDRNSCRVINDTSKYLQEKPLNECVSCQSDFSESQTENTKVNDLENNGCLQTEYVISNVKTEVNDTTDKLEDLSSNICDTKIDIEETNHLHTENLIASEKTEANQSTKELEDSGNTLNNTKDNSAETNPIDPENPAVTVKAEATDTIKELEDFGNDFTMTILDIEDPFLVIEISSDSSSEDEDYLESYNDVAKEPLDTDKRHNET